MRNAKSENEKKWGDFLAKDLNSSGNADLAFARLGELVRNDMFGLMMAVSAFKSLLV